MNASQLLQDIETGCLVEIESAACRYHDTVRGLDVRQSFYVYPNDTVVCLNAVDGGYATIVLSDDDVACLRARNPFFFQ